MTATAAPATAANAAEATLGKLTLRVRGPKGSTQTVVLSSACCRIGSGDRCALRVRAPGVRDVHCVIFRGPRRSVVRGLAKETWLNGAIFFESPLNVGDCLRLGRLEIDVLEDERLRVPVRDGHAAAAELDDEARTAPRTKAEDQLQQLVAGQTAELSPERLASPSPAEQPSVSEAPPTAAQRELASVVQDVVRTVRRVEEQVGQFDQRLIDVGSQSAASAGAVEEVRSARAAWDEKLQTWDVERQQADAAWRQSLADFAQRLQGIEALAAQVAALGTAAPPNNDHADELRRQLDDRLATLEQRVERDHEQTAEREAAVRQAMEQWRDAAERPLSGLQGDLAALRDRTQHFMAELPQAVDELRRRHADDAALGRSLVERSDQLAERSDQLAERSDQLAERCDQLAERCDQLEAALAEPRQSRNSECAATPPSADVEPIWGQTCLVAPGERRQWLSSASAANAVADDFLADEVTLPADDVTLQHEVGDPVASTLARAFAVDQGGLSEHEPAAELVFEQVSRDAPLSTAEVLRQMGASVDFDSEEPAQPTRFEAEPARPPRSSRPTEIRDPSEEEEGVAIEQYMSQLLERMRAPGEDVTKTSPMPAASPPKTPATHSRATKPTRPPQAPVAAPLFADEATEVDMPARELAPRTMPAEISADMTAMRALANNTARAAIDTHQRRGQMQVTQGKLLVAGVAIAVSGTLLWFFAGASHLALASAIVSLAIALCWMIQYVVLKAKLRGKDRPSTGSTKTSPRHTASALDAADSAGMNE